MSWSKQNRTISFSTNGEIAFTDSIDHWENAFLRLTGFTDTDARHWVENAAQAWPQEQGLATGLQAMQSATRSLFKNAFPANTQLEKQTHPKLGWVSDRVWASAIGDDNTAMLIGNTHHGWLVSADDLKLLTEPEYEEEYFEGSQDRVGYGDYLEQQSWRLEKAARQVGELKSIATMLGHPLSNGAAVLDVGSGYGFFRQAAYQANLDCHGVEVSNYACRTAKELFDMDTFCGDLDMFAESTSTKFQAITMWDVIEHVSDPVALLSTTRELLAPGGLLFVRTPNLHAAEFVAFGNLYHSLKREHLHIFSPFSLAEVMHRAGITPKLTQSSSHLLGGFPGFHTQVVATALQGSDLLAVGSNDAS